MKQEVDRGRWIGLPESKHLVKKEVLFDELDRFNI